MAKPLTVGSLFAGIGGFDLGLERAGMKTAWFCEQNTYCQKVLAKHWPKVPCYDDVCEIGAHNVKPVDILAGGFPCQDISTAGKGAGLAGARSSLWREFARLIGELRPSYVIVENVPALRRRGLHQVLHDLDACGYDAEWDGISASAVGAPHRRDRIWIVAYHNSDDGRSWGARGFAPGSERQSEPERALHVPVPNAGGRNWRAGTVSSDEGWWASEPDVGRGLDGFSRWLDGRDLNADALHGLRAEDLRVLQRRVQASPATVYADISAEQVLLAYLRQLTSRCDGGDVALACPEAAGSEMRGMRDDTQAPGSPCRSGHSEQPSDQHPDALQGVPRLLARDAEATWLAYRRSDACPQLGWEDGIARVADGVPHRVHRLRALGNSLVPQIAQWVGEQIVAFDNG